MKKISTNGITYLEPVPRDLSGNVIEILPGDVMLMPDGEIWHPE